MAEYEEKTERATPRKRQKAREKGQVARSRDLSSMAAMGGIIITLYFAGNNLINNIMNMTGNFLSLHYGREPFALMKTATLETFFLLLPIFAVSITLAICVNLFQGGFVIKPFKVEINKINPLEGIKKIFSKNGLTEFLKSLLKFSIGGYLLYYVIRKDFPVFPALMNMGLNEIATVSANLILKAITYGFLCFFIISIISYFLERWRFEQSLKMTKEEIKEERKETEGNPLLKSRIKTIQRELARKRMMQEVPKATVVITNPTHLAVALKYEDKKMHAPQIIAKGAGFVAEKIKEIAKRKGIPIVEDKPLARMLYKHELNSYIPKDLYKAVAKILAYIYKLKGAV